MLNAHGVVPPEITSGVLKFAQEVSPGHRPKYVPVIPVPRGRPADCFNNVRLQIESGGGEMQCGWAIWLIPQIMIEAEHHAVWVGPDGRVVDVSPYARSLTKTLFLPDPRQTDLGKPIDNIRRPISNDPLVDEFIARSRRKYELLYETHADVPFGREVRLTPDEYDEVFPDAPAFDRAFMSLVVSKRRAQDPCICGSARQFRRCCGKGTR